MINDRDFVKITRGKIYKDDYIKREDVVAMAWNAIYEDEFHMHRLDKVVSVSDIAKLPSADVEERKRGRWNCIQGGMSVCPYCGASPHDYFKNYCPNCGTDMRGEDDV